MLYSTDNGALYQLTRYALDCYAIHGMGQTWAVWTRTMHPDLLLTCTGRVDALVDYLGIVSIRQQSPVRILSAELQLAVLDLQHMRWQIVRDVNQGATRPSLDALTYWEDALLLITEWERETLCQHENRPQANLDNAYCVGGVHSIRHNLANHLEYDPEGWF